MHMDQETVIIHMQIEICNYLLLKLNKTYIDYDPEFELNRKLLTAVQVNNHHVG